MGVDTSYYLSPMSMLPLNELKRQNSSYCCHGVHITITYMSILEKVLPQCDFFFHQLLPICIHNECLLSVFCQWHHLRRSVQWPLRGGGWTAPPTIPTLTRPCAQTEAVAGTTSMWSPAATTLLLRVSGSIL